MDLKELSKQFAERATQTPRATARVEQALQGLAEEYFADPTRRDGRGRRAKCLREAETGLRHLTRAVVWQQREGLDPNIRQEARALVKTACHGHVPFEDLMRRASALRGRVNRSGQARNARMPIRGCRKLRAELPRRFVVERLHTVARLAGAGRKLGNCAKDNAYGLHDKLRRRKSDFYLVLRGSDPEAMFEVNLKTAEITEFLGRRNRDVALPRPVLLAMLRRLRLDGDHVEACLQQGAVSIFATGTADPRRPDWRRGRRKVWCRPRRLVVREGRKKRRRWSSFEWDGADWVASDASSQGRLDALMTRYPPLAELAHRAMVASRGR